MNLTAKRNEQNEQVSRGPSRQPKKDRRKEKKGRCFVFIVGVIFGILNNLHSFSEAELFGLSSLVEKRHAERRKEGKERKGRERPRGLGC